MGRKWNKIKNRAAHITSAGLVLFAGYWLYASWPLRGGEWVAAGGAAAIAIGSAIHLLRKRR